MELWQWALMALISAVACGASVFGVILVVMGRDRSLIQFIGQSKAETMAAIELAKDDLRKYAKSGHDDLHARINRVQETFVRRDDFDAHERRAGKSFDDLRADMRRLDEKQEARHNEIKQLMQSTLGLGRVFPVPPDKL